MGELRPEETELARERMKRVFRFLRAVAERSLTVERTLAEHSWVLRVADLPQHPDVQVGVVEFAAPGGEPSQLDDADAGADKNVQNAPLIRVRRPKTTLPPEPPEPLREWLLAGWEACDGAIHVAETRHRVTAGGSTMAEGFADQPARVELLRAWRAQWDTWARAERPAHATEKLFSQLYELRSRMEREGERLELMLGDGRLRWQRDGDAIDHPVLLQRVELEFDPKGLEFRILDADRDAELYTPLLHGSDGVSGVRIAALQDELQSGGYHPLAREGTAGFLRQLVALLSARGEFVPQFVDGELPPDPQLCRDPVLFLRPRSSGLPMALDRVLAHLDDGGELPPALVRLTGIEPPPLEGPAPGAPVPPWSEPPDVLLSKPANAEQVQIARALERHRAVLVQGPPGTGKSHTIANLIGHLVAQGKRVLVTAHTTKALRVLRDKVVEPLQPLCVAVLDNDLESRAQLESAVRGIVTRLTASSEEPLTREIARWTRTRQELLSQVEELAGVLRTVREGEYLPIVVDGDAVPPCDAAREAHLHAAAGAWLPGPVSAGVSLPLLESELIELYGTNGSLTPAEELELGEALPRDADLPPPEWFANAVATLDATESPALARYWSRPPRGADFEALALLARKLTALTDALTALVPWQRSVVAAGRAGGGEAELWRSFATLTHGVFETWQQHHTLLMEHVPEFTTIAPEPGDSTLLREIRDHLDAGGGFGRFTLLRKRAWKRLLEGCTVNGQRPGRAEHFAALSALVETAEIRRNFGARWDRQAVAAGLPLFESMPDPREPIANEYASQFATLLTLWSSHWDGIASDLQGLGFAWQTFRQAETARLAPAPAFELDASLIAGPLLQAVRARGMVARRQVAEARLHSIAESLEPYRGAVCTALREAFEQHDPGGYREQRGRLQALRLKLQTRARRDALLARLEPASSSWATAIRKRIPPHDAAQAPGDVRRAWRWRQLEQEMARRAQLDEVALARRLDQAQQDLREATTNLIDRLAWRAQLRRTDLASRQALVGWLDTQRKIGKGTGARVPALQQEARKLLAKAQAAVPVWIMPFARVAESFDPQHGRFDVVIVDEASQSDVTGLLAWYLGDSVAIVGDDEQVSPLAVGQRLDDVQALISEHLHGIPNGHLYDGRTSIYDLAKQCFGGTIGLREHFRCVPDIIEFSNQLSYGGEIRPLRDPSTAARPHVVEYRVPADMAAGREGKANHAEARAIAALMQAACEQPEYDGKSMGAITLLGDEQAELIQRYAVETLGAAVLEERRFVAGNSAQYQGDERHVIWLSMVDVPADAALRRSDAPATKQRFNVAASRARDQLWLVHSLDPGRDLKAGDLRRRLIEHCRDPRAHARALQQTHIRAASPLESEILRRLTSAGYQVSAQVQAGHYRIDLVVADGLGQVAVECDGDRMPPLDAISEDMARQAVLERAGWRFVRIRGTRFYRDPDTVMQWVYGELARHGVRPARPGAPAPSAPGRDGRELAERVQRRAAEILRAHGWVAGPDLVGRS